MNRILVTLLLALCSTLLPAAVVANGGGTAPVQPDPGTGTRASAEPAWVADPTEGGKKQAVTFSWAAGAAKEDQKKARADALAKLIATFKLPETVRAKDMNQWVDPNGKTFVQLVVR